jgi:type IV secretory pathway VirD2 relaxase
VADQNDLRARVAEALYVEPEAGAAPQTVEARRMEAAHRAYAAMTVVGPELAAKDARIAGLEAALQAALRARPAAPAADTEAAATWPSRAARRLEADAHPTTERSGR